MNFITLQPNAEPIQFASNVPKSTTFPNAPNPEILRPNVAYAADHILRITEDAQNIPKTSKKNRSTANQKTTAPASTLAPIPKITTPLSATYSTTPSPVGTYANPVSVPEVQKSKPIQNSQHLIPKNSPTIDPQTQQIISLFTEMQQKFNTMIDGMAKTLVSVLMPQSPN